ncbi:hypothetical protein CO038_02835 [Candidatus Pacearchaeota archaeon CG_4_9_14_0_2_um_filter_39_13]|nr:hypothetical protein [Candidatus Pacearchaeota archaeon]OIO42860.1 MAG: hypothetical protein AUJ64_03420 [Candidatus Pacearchaeota archaeon CG1_02_39_14]PJC44623.1 MAG: hypothetical protein CO038_02835 [Candidatus Pacearchaeota archaeon CG_4_9_14_0_2_um_filter_39_13]
MESSSDNSRTRELYKKFDEIFEYQVKPYIEKIMPRDKFSAPVYYILDNFVMRRFRSGLPVLIAKSYGIGMEKVLPLAAANELMFAIALVQDDFFDNSSVRGEIESAHIKFGVRAAMASSDYCYTYAIKILRELEKTNIDKSILNKIYDSFTEIQERVFASFLMEILNEANLEFTANDVLELHKAKTVHGTNLTYCVGLLCEEKEAGLADKLLNYSTNIAIAGQIKNDIYDITRYSKTRGFVDLINGYQTYLLAKLIDSLNEKELGELGILFKQGKAGEIVKIMAEKNIIEKSISDQKEYIQKARDILKKIENPEVSLILNTWADGSEVREYPSG